MNDADFAKYRDGRYKDYVDYYDRRAVTNKFWHYASSVYVLTVSVLITPMVSVDCLKDWGVVAAGILAPSIALVTGIAARFKFHDNWLDFRATWDALNHESACYETGIGPYATAADRKVLFVERAESLISQQGREWLNRHSAKQQPSQGSASTVAHE